MSPKEKKWEVRGISVDDEVVKEAKILKKKRKMTLGQYVAQALKDLNSKI